MTALLKSSAPNVSDANGCAKAGRLPRTRRWSLGARCRAEDAVSPVHMVMHGHVPPTCISSHYTCLFRFRHSPEGLWTKHQQLTCPSRRLPVATNWWNFAARSGGTQFYWDQHEAYRSPTTVTSNSCLAGNPSFGGQLVIL